MEKRREERRGKKRNRAWPRNLGASSSQISFASEEICIKEFIYLSSPWIQETLFNFLMPSFIFKDNYTYNGGYDSIARTGLLELDPPDTVYKTFQ